MVKKKTSIAPFLRSVLLTAAALLAGCQPETPLNLPEFNAEQAYAEVEDLVKISPRDAGTPGGLRAAEHIFNRLRSFGIETEIDTFNDQTPRGEKRFNNVIGRLPGKNGRWIILGSHFDTMPGIDDFQGANDSGSSTGVLLELARMLAGQQPQTGILFAFFDGEEGIADYIPGDGLHGSRHMVKELTASGEIHQIEAMILLDMVGDKNLHFTIPANSSRGLVKEILNAAEYVGYRDRCSLERRMQITDDHVPFLEAGIPAIDLIDFHYGSRPRLNDYWHTKDDSMEHIGVESLEITGTIMHEALKRMAFGIYPD
ncbi:MAG TPA: M28 family peptidase [Pontiella sp.]